MTRLFDPPISTSNLYSPDVDRLCEIFRGGCDESGQLVAGQLVGQLETQLCQYHGAKHCVVFATGFWALVATVMIRSREDRSQVIIPSFTYRRLADVVYWAGKVPVMVDIQSETLAIDPQCVQAAINQETALILAVHPIVNCCQVQALISVASETGIPIAFDAVESVHESIDGRRIGSFGVGEVFSFHASKLINGVEGGYVCTDDPNFRDQLVQFRSSGSGTDNKLGIESVMCDGHAAYALASLASLDVTVQHNRRIYEAYRSALRSIRGLRLLLFDDAQQTSFKNVVVEVTEQFPIDRDELVVQLNSDGVLARAHYWPPLHAKMYRYDIQAEALPVTERAATRLINLPCGQPVTIDDVQTVCRRLDLMTEIDHA